MKKILTFILTAFAAASCCSIYPYEDVESNNRNGRKLVRYSEEILDRFCTAQADALNYMLTLNEFLKLSEEEKNDIRWEGFRSEIEHYSETYFRISPRGIKLETKGLSLTDPGTSWIMEIIDEYYFMGDSQDYYDWSYDRFQNFPGHSNFIRISCTARDRYEITDEKGKEIMIVSLEAIPSKFGGYDFSGSGSGSVIPNRRELSATYSISDFYYRRHRIDSDGTGNAAVAISYNVESANVRLDTFHHGKPLDWCEIIMTKDKETEYRSNLEIRDEPLYRE